MKTNGINELKSRASRLERSIGDLEEARRLLDDEITRLSADLLEVEDNITRMEQHNGQLSEARTVPELRVEG